MRFSTRIASISIAVAVVAWIAYSAMDARRRLIEVDRKLVDVEANVDMARFEANMARREAHGTQQVLDATTHPVAHLICRSKRTGREVDVGEITPCDDDDRAKCVQGMRVEDAQVKCKAGGFDS